MFNNIIEIFKDTYEEHKFYEISNALVKPINEKYINPMTTCAYQWTLTQRTSILPINEIFEPPLKRTPEFTDSNKFESLMIAEKLFSK